MVPLITHCFIDYVNLCLVCCFFRLTVCLFSLFDLLLCLCCLLLCCVCVCPSKGFQMLLDLKTDTFEHSKVSNTVVLLSSSRYGMHLFTNSLKLWFNKILVEVSSTVTSANAHLYDFCIH